MTRWIHRCDPRSDYQCPECAERQLAEERERDGDDAANLAAERVEAILGDEASVDVTADGFVSILVPASLAARICLEADEPYEYVHDGEVHLCPSYLTPAQRVVWAEATVAARKGGMFQISWPEGADAPEIWMIGHGGERLP